MIRFIVKEVYVGHVVFSGGIPETRMHTIDGNLDELENFLRQKDLPGPNEHLIRELVGIEMLEAHADE